MKEKREWKIYLPNFQKLKLLIESFKRTKEIEDYKYLIACVYFNPDKKTSMPLRSYKDSNKAEIL